jgi:hypothetical protein
MADCVAIILGNIEGNSRFLSPVRVVCEPADSVRAVAPAGDSGEGKMGFLQIHDKK